MSFRGIALGLFLATALWTGAQEVRLVNGFVVQGKVVAVTDKGVEVKGERDSRTYEWAVLSIGTRYRYEVKFRANLRAVLDGKPVSERKIAPDPAYKPPVGG